MAANLDILLKAIENPMRRRLLYKLSHEPHYPLQLSHELKISQQAIAKHLKVLEEAGIIKHYRESSSSGGPPRTYYRTTNNFSIRIDVGTRIFDVELQKLDRSDSELPGVDKEPDMEVDDLLCTIKRRYREASEIRDPLDRVRHMSELIESIEGSVRSIENERFQLCRIKNEILDDAQNLMNSIDDYEERTILYDLLCNVSPTVKELSEEFDVRESVIEEVLERLRSRGILPLRRQNIVLRSTSMEDSENQNYDR